MIRILLIIILCTACAPLAKEQPLSKPKPTYIKLKKGEVEWNSLGHSDLKDNYAIELQKGRTYDIEIHRDQDGITKESLDVFLTSPEGNNIELQEPAADSANKVSVGKVTPGTDGIYYLEVRLGKKLPAAKIYGMGYSEEDEN